jgi:hypothetical protein
MFHWNIVALEVVNGDITKFDTIMNYEVEYVLDFYLIKYIRVEMENDEIKKYK